MKLKVLQKQLIIEYFSKRPEVAGVFLYGSQIKNKSGRLSDVDLAVLPTRGIDNHDLDLQLEYIGSIQEILKNDLAADVKILDGEKALIFEASVINEGELIVNNSPDDVENFTKRVAMQYPDFYPVLRNYFSKMNQRLMEGNYASGH